MSAPTRIRRLPTGDPLELVELSLGAVVKAREALEFGDVEEGTGMIGAAEENLGTALLLLRMAA